mgnify:CR=1 FL=1
MIPAAARLFNTVFNTCSHFETVALYHGECLKNRHDNKCPGSEVNYDSHDMHSE